MLYLNTIQRNKDKGKLMGLEKVHYG